MKFVFSILLFFALTACSKQFNRENLAGKYTLKDSAGTGIIELKEDGTYIHSFQNKNGADSSQNGKWELVDLDAGPTVRLNNFEPLPSEQTGGLGSYFLEIGSSWGKTILMTNPDLNEGYQKQP